MSIEIPSVSQLKWPADWSMHFGREAMLIVEVGFGDSTFLTHLGRKYPKSNVLGLEISRPAINKAKKRIEEAKLGNIRLLKASAQVVLWFLCDFRSIEALYINFPDPWPKPGHHERRVINERFLELAATRMKPGALLRIATDHEEYADWINCCLQQSSYFTSSSKQPYIIGEANRINTKYERIALAERKACYYFEWERNETVSANFFRFPKELPVPHVVLHLSMTAGEISRHFVPRSYSEDRFSIRLINLYHSPSRQTLVVDAYVREDPLEQRVFLMAKRRENDEYIVQLHEVGFPRPTSGIHFAIQYFADWLCSLHGDAQIIHHNLRIAPTEENV